jgi:hypothetical protein
VTFYTLLAATGKLSRGLPIDDAIAAAAKPIAGKVTQPKEKPVELVGANGWLASTPIAEWWKPERRPPHRLCQANVVICQTLSDAPVLFASANASNPLYANPIPS